VSFQLENGDFPRIAKADDTNFVAFTYDDNLFTNHLATNTDQNCGTYFLADASGIVTNALTNSMNLIISYSTPVANASGVVLDIDSGQGGYEAWQILAYNSTNLIDSVTLLHTTPNAGDGLATQWSFTHSSPDITSVRIEYVGQRTTDIGFAFDNFSPAWTALPPALSLRRTNNVSLLEITGKCDSDPYYQIDWTSSLSATNWQLLTNVFLTNAPLSFVLDQTSASVAERFYRATEVFAPCVSAPTGLVAWWPGDGTATNIFGTNIGTLSPSGASFKAGKVSEAFNFSGTNSYVQTTLDVQPKVMSNTTWEAWVYLTQINYSDGLGILSDDAGNYGRSLNIRPDSSFAIGTGTTEWEPVVASLNEWQHVALVYSPTNILFYKNGVQYSYGSAPSGQSTTYLFFIGKNPGTGFCFQGMIDEVSIYNRALSATEIQTIYNAGSAGKCK
jgi:hypothetical protein